MIKAGLIGLGYWGPNLARVLSNSERCEFVACCDIDPRRTQRITRQYPSVKPYTDFKELIASDIDAGSVHVARENVRLNGMAAQVAAG